VTYVAQLISGIVGLLLVPFLISRLGEDEFGVIGVSNAVLEFAVLVDLGTRPAAARQFTHFRALGDLRRANELASSAMAAYGVMALSIAGLVVIAGSWLLLALGVSTALLGQAHALLLFAALSVGVTLLRSVYDAALWSQLRHDIPYYVQILSVLLRAGIVVVTYLVWSPQMVIWSLSSLVGALLAIVILRRQAHRQCPGLELSPRLVSRRGLRDLAGFSVYTSLLRLSEWMWLSSSPAVISFYLGTGAVAHFAPAAAVVSAFQPLSRAFLVQLTPVVTKTHAAGDRVRLARLFLESTRYSLLSNGAASVLIATLAFPLCELWLGKGFGDTAWVLALLCVRELLHASIGGAFPIFVGTGSLRAVALVSLATAVGGMALGAYLVGPAGIGIAGSAIAFVATQAFRIAFDYWRASSLCGVPHLHYLREAVLGPSVSLAATGVSSLLVQHLLEADPLVEILAATGVAGLAFAVSAWSLGLKAADRDRLLAFARSAIGNAGSRGR
jgi:O-antigen/teichoic acid export membrane protein